MSVAEPEVEREPGIVGHVEDDLLSFGPDVETVGHR
jgi:hypothetical protein